MNAFNTIAFSPMLIIDVFESVKASTAWYDKSKLSESGEKVFPFVSRSRASNGVDDFCVRQQKEPEPGNAITIGLDTQTVAYQPVAFYTGQNIQVLRHPLLTPSIALVLVAIINKQMAKFSWGGNGATLGRLRKTRIMVPVVSGKDGQEIVDWEGMRGLGEELLSTIATRALNACSLRLATPLDQLVLQ